MVAALYVEPKGCYVGVPRAWPCGTRAKDAQYPTAPSEG